MRDLTERPASRDMSFELRRGEILGLAGLIGVGPERDRPGDLPARGQGQRRDAAERQALRLRHYRDSIDDGIVYLSEDRKGDGIFLDMSIAANVSALRSSRSPTFRLIIDELASPNRPRRWRRSISNTAISASPSPPCRAAISRRWPLPRCSSVNPKVIFLDEPTRGVDVGAKAEIHRILRDLAREGVGILVISSELPELIGVCDRVLVVREGRITGEVAGDQMTEEDIMHLASIGDEQRLAS